MLNRLGRHVTYANVVASLALFLALSGTAYAVATITGADVVNESLTGADIKGAAASGGHAAVDGTITTHDIKDKTIKSPDLAPSSVNGAKVKDNTLTGDDITESSLGQVPWASFADQASVAAPPTIEKWRYVGDSGQPAFENGWVNYDSAISHSAASWPHVSFAKDAFGFVHLHGMIKGGVIGQVMFRLPGTYCPWFYHAFPAISNNAIARVTVTYLTDANNCWVYADTGSNQWVSLDGITFQSYPLESRTKAPAGTDAPQLPKSVPGAPPRKELKQR